MTAGLDAPFGRPSGSRVSRDPGLPQIVPSDNGRLVGVAAGRLRLGWGAKRESEKGAIRVHAVVVEVSINDFEEARKQLGESLVPGVSRAPGFVSGVWVAFDGNKGCSVVVFESEEAANAAAGQVRTMAAGVTFDSVSVGEVVARA
jgi:hypothetical protein